MARLLPLCLLGSLPLLGSGCSEGTKPNPLPRAGTQAVDAPNPPMPAKPAALDPLKPPEFGDPIPAPEKKLSLYDRLGGAKGIERLADEYVRRLFDNAPTAAEVRLHFSSADELKRRLATYFSALTGGPPLPEDKTLQNAHDDLGFFATIYDPAVEQLGRACANLEIAEANRDALIAALALMRKSKE